MRLGFKTRVSVFCAAAGAFASVALAATIVAATAVMPDVPPHLILVLRALAAVTCLLFTSAGVAWVFSEHHGDGDRDRPSRDPEAFRAHLEGAER